jgi:hypothetical protein
VALLADLGHWHGVVPFPHLGHWRGVLPLAHLGHWYFQLAFAAPALVLIGWMARDSLRRRRSAGKAGEARPIRDADGPNRTSED